MFPLFIIFQVKAARIFAYLWMLFQPVLFGLVGAEVSLENVRSEFVGQAMGVICIGLVFRMLAAVIATTKSGLNWKEKLFTAIAWLPKAAVQAALGSVALDYARKINAGPETIVLGEQVRIFMEAKKIIVHNCK